ncbi:hypothetical protein ACLKA6_018855 [Drosophila palustris]
MAKIIQRVATFLLYVDRLKAQQKTQIKPDKVNLELINRAQNLLFKQAQAHGYFNEISKLSAKLPLESSDDVALTPNHLLLGTVDGYKPICSDELDLRQRWHQSQSFGDQFWKRWVKEYAPVLTKRSKWFEKTTPIQIGSVVVVVDENLPRNMWPMGRIINTITAKDGQVRRVTIKTNKGTMERPATKVAVLDVGKP